MAAIMISDILKPDGDTSYELTVKAMLDYGYKKGGRCCGTILYKAATDFRALQQAGKDPSQYNLYPDTLDVFKLITMSVNTNQSLRLIFGTNDNVAPLRVSQNLTLINAGDRSMIPEPGAREHRYRTYPTLGASYDCVRRGCRSKRTRRNGRHR